MNILVNDVANLPPKFSPSEFCAVAIACTEYSYTFKADNGQLVNVLCHISRVAKWLGITVKPVNQDT